MNSLYRILFSNSYGKQTQLDRLAKINNFPIQILINAGAPIISKTRIKYPKNPPNAW